MLPPKREQDNWANRHKALPRRAGADRVIHLIFVHAMHEAAVRGGDAADVPAARAPRREAVGPTDDPDRRRDRRRPPRPLDVPLFRLADEQARGGAAAGAAICHCRLPHGRFEETHAAETTSARLQINRTLGQTTEYRRQTVCTDRPRIQRLPKSAPNVPDTSTGWKTHRST